MPLRQARAWSNGQADRHGQSGRIYNFKMVQHMYNIYIVRVYIYVYVLHQIIYTSTSRAKTVLDGKSQHLRNNSSHQFVETSGFLDYL